MSRRSSPAGLSPVARLSQQLAQQERNRPSEPLVTPEARQHGEFTEEFIQRPDGSFGNVTTRGRGPMKQWRENGVFAPEQFYEMGEYKRAKDKVASTSHLVANYDDDTRGGDAASAELERVSAILFLKFLEEGVLSYFDRDRVAVFDAIVVDGLKTDEAARHFRRKIGSNAERVRETVGMISTAISRWRKKGA